MSWRGCGVTCRRHGVGSLKLVADPVERDRFAAPVLHTRLGDAALFFVGDRLVVERRGEERGEHGVDAPDFEVAQRVASLVLGEWQDLVRVRETRRAAIAANGAVSRRPELDSNQRPTPC
jgi:hypothetical protein